MVDVRADDGAGRWQRQYRLNRRVGEAEEGDVDGEENPRRERDIHAADGKQGEPFTQQISTRVGISSKRSVIRTCAGGRGIPHEPGFRTPALTEECAREESRSDVARRRGRCEHRTTGLQLQVLLPRRGVLVLLRRGYGMIGGGQGESPQLRLGQRRALLDDDGRGGRHGLGARRSHVAWCQ